MPASAFLLLASGSAARVASLNLCTDEYLLLLGRPQQIVSVSYLSRDPLESPLWRQARRYRANRGSIEDVLTARPTLVLTMGGGGRATALLAKRLHLDVIDLPYAADLEGLARNIRLIASVLGDPARAEPWLARLNRLQATEPKQAVDSIWISGGGWSLAPTSLGGQWLRLAGFRQRSLTGGRATLETLLTKPPKVLIKSDYRSRQMSGGERWLDNPIVRHSGARQLVTDGRPWTCLGPPMIPEIERLRSLAR
jgi:iron complex transport system substrate-binding protein